MTQYLLVVGNLTNEVTKALGPFDSEAEAREFSLNRYYSWGTFALTPPQEEEARKDGVPPSLSDEAISDAEEFAGQLCETVVAAALGRAAQAGLAEHIIIEECWFSMLAYFHSQGLGWRGAPQIVARLEVAGTLTTAGVYRGRRLCRSRYQRSYSPCSEPQLSNCRAAPTTCHYTVR